MDAFECFAPIQEDVWKNRDRLAGENEDPIHY